MISGITVTIFSPTSFFEALGREERLPWTVKGPQLQQGNVLGNLGGKHHEAVKAGKRTASCYELHFHSHFPVSRHFKADPREPWGTTLHTSAVA